MTDRKSTSPEAASRRAIFAWVLYDFANSPFTTLVITFVYAQYFTEAIAATSVEGTALWGYTMTATALTVALFSPVLGALADQGGYRKRFLLPATVISAAATAALYGVLPGEVGRARHLGQDERRDQGDDHRSTSPMTMSKLPMMATMSATMQSPREVRASRTLMLQNDGPRAFTR